MKKVPFIFSFIFTFLLMSCNFIEKPKHKKEVFKKKPQKISYSLQKSSDWLKENSSDANKIEFVTAINRTDKASLSQMDSLIIPNEYNGDLAFYLPFPIEIDYLEDVDKILFFSYPTQTFAAYENGILVYTGPTNMGRKADPTPTGLFFTNWKAEETTSTFNDEWDLKWNFNIANKLGVGFHEYHLPGYPASHSCLRLQEKDAKYLYNWADQWVLEDSETIKVKGTPVIVFGNYPFDSPKPWLKLIKNPNALALSEGDIINETKPYLDKILKEQKVRKSYIIKEE